MSQPKLHSFIEAVGGTMLGWTLSVLLGHWVVYPMFDIDISLATNAGATTVFTFISMARQYVTRRIGNWWQHHRGE